MKIEHSGIVFDRRFGCVAVYRGKPRPCLGSISRDPDCIFYRAGTRVNKIWHVHESDELEALEVFKKESRWEEKAKS